jgi:hypothetical protein
MRTGDLIVGAIVVFLLYEWWQSEGGTNPFVASPNNIISSISPPNQNLAALPGQSPVAGRSGCGCGSGSAAVAPAVVAHPVGFGTATYNAIA